jgi:tRNA nucleotidyltransferase (CCA-adding enzyme)
VGSTVDLDSLVPREVTHVMRVLESAGYQAYLVGGSVRDILLHRRPMDYDVATDALPHKVEKLFHNVIPTGLKYGTVTVHDSIDVEVTTFRKDGRYLDGRRPESVTFSTSLEDDVFRRDFTINALALSLAGEVIDYVQGKRDLLDLRVIRCVGDPDQRFREDALRMIRAHRFVAQLSSPEKPFSIETKSLAAIKRNAHLIVNVSWERIRDELTKILMSDNPKSLGDLYDSDLLNYTLPELAACHGFPPPIYHRKDVFEHTLAVVDASSKRLWVRLAALLHDIGKPTTFVVDERGFGYFHNHHAMGARMAEKVLDRLKYDSRTISVVTTLVREHMTKSPCLKHEDRDKQRNVKRLINRVGVEHLEDFFDLKRADILGSAPPHDFSELDALKEEVYRVLNSGEPLTLKDLAVSGRDLIDWGMTQGKQIGDVLDSMLEAVLERPELNTRERLKALFHEMRERAKG